MNRKDHILSLRKKVGNTQCFFTQNWIGDPMQTISKYDGITLLYCHNWDYYEVLGLTTEEINLFLHGEL